MRGSQRTDNNYDTAFPSKFRVEGGRYDGSDLPVSELIKKLDLDDYVPGLATEDEISEDMDTFFRESLSSQSTDSPAFESGLPDNYKERSQRILNIHYTGLAQQKAPDMPEIQIYSANNDQESGASFAPGPDYSIQMRESWNRARYNQNFFSADADNKIVDNGYSPALIQKNNFKDRERYMKSRYIFANSEIVGNRTAPEYNGVTHKSLNEVYDVGDTEMNMRINSIDAETAKAIRSYKPNTFMFSDANSSVYEKLNSLGVVTNPNKIHKSSSNGREYFIEGQKYKNAFTPDARSIGKINKTMDLSKNTDSDIIYDESDKNIKRKRMIDVVNNLLQAKQLEQLIGEHDETDTKRAKLFDKKVQDIIHQVKSDDLKTNNANTYFVGPCLRQSEYCLKTN